MAAFSLMTISNRLVAITAEEDSMVDTCNRLILCKLMPIRRRWASHNNNNMLNLNIHPNNSMGNNNHNIHHNNSMGKVNNHR